MKLLTLILLTTFAFAQPPKNDIFGWNKSGKAMGQSRYTRHSSYVVDTVLNIGNDSCGHSWVLSDGEQKGLSSGCLVYHTDGNCSWNWFVGKRICSICLRKEKIHEVVTTKEIKSAYERLDENILGKAEKKTDSTFRFYGKVKLFDTLFIPERQNYFYFSNTLKIDTDSGTITFHKPADSAGILFARWFQDTYSFRFDSLKQENTKLKFLYKEALRLYRKQIKKGE